MKYLVLSFFLNLITCYSYAQTQQPLLGWAVTFDAHNVNNYRTYSNGRTVGVDKKGNVYSAGLFEHTVDFDPGAGVYTLTGGSGGELGIYISKLDSGGKFVWAKQIPVLVEFDQIELKVDENGNVYLAAEFKTAADMDPGPGVLIMKPIGVKDAFVVKLDTNGNLVWAKQFGGPGDTVSYSNVLELDSFGNVIICGGFNNTIDFDPGVGTFTLTSTAHIQSFIVKLTSAGSLIWAKQFGNASVVLNGSEIIDVKCDQKGNIYTIGVFTGNCDFDPGASTYFVQATNTRDGFISKLDANGGFISAKRIDPCEMRGIAIDSQNDILITGWFSGGPKDFNPGANVDTLRSSGSDDAFILKLTENIDFLWVKKIGGKDSDTGNDIVVDIENNVYIIGGFGTSVDFNPGPADSIINSPYYGASAVVKLDPEGNFVYAATFPSISYGSSLFRRMEIDRSGNVYITGYVAGIVDFDPGPGSYPLSGPMNEAPFVLKLSPSKKPSPEPPPSPQCDQQVLIRPGIPGYGLEINNLCSDYVVINLYNAIGQLILRRNEKNTSNTFSTNINLNHFPKAVYFLEIITVAGRTTHKLMNL